MRSILRLAGVIALSLAPAVVLAQGIQRGSGLPAPLPLFPADNWWNVDISGAPVATNSAASISFIGSTRGLHPDFGAEVDPSDPSLPDVYGMVYITVPGTQPLVPVTFVEFGGQSDSGAPGRPVGYPIPDAAKTGTRWIEGGTPANLTQAGNDDHMLLVDRDNRILYELYHAYWDAVQNRWEAGIGGGLPARLQPAPAGRLDERRRRRARHPARPDPL